MAGESSRRAAAALARPALAAQGARGAAKPPPRPQQGATGLPRGCGCQRSIPPHRHQRDCARRARWHPPRRATLRRRRRGARRHPAAATAQGVGGRRVDGRHDRHLRRRLECRLQRKGGRQYRRNPLDVSLVQRGHNLLVAFASEGGLLDGLDHLLHSLPDITVRQLHRVPCRWPARSAWAATCRAPPSSAGRR